MPKPDVAQEPTVELIRELHTWIHQHWSPQFTLDAHLRRVAEDDHTVRVPDTSDKRRKNRQEPEKMNTGIGSHIIRVVGALYEGFTEVGVQWTGAGTAPTQRADQVEIALAEARDQLNPATDSPRSREIKQKLVLGRSAQLILPGDAYWWDTPKFGEEHYENETNVEHMNRLKLWKAKAPLPILWEDLPADSTFPASIGRIDDEVLSTKSMTWYELLDVFEPAEIGDILPPPEKRHQLVTVGIYANRNWISWSVLAEDRTHGVPLTGWLGSYPDKIIRKIEHKMGRCPIRITAGFTGTYKEPGVVWKSVLHDVRFMIEQTDARFSEAATASKFSAIPWIKLWRRSKEEDITPAAVQASIETMLSGDVIDLEPADGQEGREDVEVLQFPPLGPGIELGQFGLQEIRRKTGATDAIEGLPGPVGGTAWERNFSAQLGRSQFAELTDSVVAYDVDTMEQIMRATTAFGEDIPLTRHDEEGGQIVLKPEDLEHFEAVLKGEFKLRLPEDKRATVEQGIGILERIINGNLPLDAFWAMETFLDIKQPTQHYKDALKTKFILAEETFNWQMKQLLSEIDIGLADVEGISLEQFEQQFAGRVPPQIAELIRGRAGGNGRDPTGELQGAVQAATPFNRAPGGPQPQERA